MDVRRRIFAAAIALLTFAAPSPAQPPSRDVHYTQQSLIRVPFTPNTSGRLKKVLLYVSTDQGREWQSCSEAAPTDRYFRDYIAPADGAYWFAVRSMDTFDQYNPPSLAQLVPEVKVVVDTRPPLVTLRQVDDPRHAHVSVDWDVRDENLDPNRLIIEYRVPGRAEWMRYERTDRTLSWKLDPGLRMEVRVRAADRAGNVGDATLQVGYGADRGLPIRGGAGGGVTSGVEFLNSRSIHIKCNVSVGISGQGVFELWYTRDGGRSWAKADKKIESPMPGNLTDKPGDAAATTALVKMIFDADADGLYGFAVVLRNGVGVGDPDPRPGDSPKFSVVVDTAEPKLQLKASAGSGADMRNVTIQWLAEDPNLTDRPVLIEYAEKRGDAPPADGDWKPLPDLPGGQDRSGTHVWTIGRDGPFKFLIRATVTDKAKNKTTETIKEPIIIDLERPRVDVTGIEPGSPRP